MAQISIVKIWKITSMKSYLDCITFYHFIGLLESVLDCLNNYKNDQSTALDEKKTIDGYITDIIKWKNDCVSGIRPTNNSEKNLYPKIYDSKKFTSYQNKKKNDINEYIKLINPEKNSENCKKVSKANSICTSKLKKLIKNYNINSQFDNIYFRGINSSDYKEIPSGLRGNKKEEENITYHEFKMKFPKDFRELNLIETLTQMQHFGLPTRLLDITSNPLVALYMACNNFDNKKKIRKNKGEIIVYFPRENDISYFDSHKVQLLAALPLLNSEEKNELLEEETDDDGVFKNKNCTSKLRSFVNKDCPGFENRIIKDDLKKCLFVKVGMINERISAQSGAFIISGLGDEDLIETTLLSTRNKKLELPKIIIENKKTLLKELLSLNINDSTIFPDMDHTANYIKKTILDER